jgi:isopentenyl-diphosphate delta-isomerase
MKETLVVLVDEKDNPIGVMEKMEAHQKAMLHRAVSVFIIDSRGAWILQKRAYHKYHSKGLWTNTCCTHPFPDESEEESASRRLMEEMGLQCNLNKLFTFIYKENLGNGLTEYELDHVFWGISDDTPIINTDEVESWMKISFEKLHQSVTEQPDLYTYWFKEIYQQVNRHIKNGNGVLKPA